MMDDVSAFLMGGKSKSVTFEQMNVWVIGTIIEPAPVLRDQTSIETGEVLTWPNGETKKQIVVTLQTDLRDPMDPEDDGARKWYVKGYAMNGLRDAIRESRAGNLQLGGKIAVAWTGNGEQKNKAYKPPKLYTIRYQAPNLLEAPGVTAPAPAPQPVPVQQTLPTDPFTQTTSAQPQAAVAQTSLPDPELAARQTSFMDRLRQQQPAPQFNGQGQPQDQEPPF